MPVKIFGKKNCSLCQTTKNKWYFLLKKWGLLSKVKLIFWDLETVDGLAEGALYAVTSIPTTVLEIGGKTIARWDGVVPFSGEIQNFLRNFQDMNYQE